MKPTPKVMHISWQNAQINTKKLVVPHKTIWSILK